MNVTRHFLGWDRPVMAKLCERLLPGRMSGPVDLSSLLIVVPTRQAGRRLREALALACAEGGNALLSPRVVLPAFFLNPPVLPADLATPLDVRAVWADVLRRCRLSEYRALFPAEVATRDFEWALRTGEQLQSLRETLVDAGLLIGDVARQFGDRLPEPERWENLARLEEEFTAALRKAGRRDPVALKIACGLQPRLPDDVQRIVVAAVPDPTPLVLRALTVLSERLPIEVLVHAPKDLAGDFDTWGRPEPEAWAGRAIDVPDEARNLLLAAAPVEQARAVISLLGEEMKLHGPNDVAIGVPDPDVVPFLTAALEEADLPPFDPEGRSADEHSLYHVLDGARDLVTSRSYRALSRFLRLHDVLGWLEGTHRVEPAALLTELDTFQNKHLPLDWDDVAARLSRGPLHDDYAHLAAAMSVLSAVLARAASAPLPPVLRDLLGEVYSAKEVRPGQPADEEFMAVARLVTDVLDEAAALPEGVNTDPGEVFELICARLVELRYYPSPRDPAVDLEGWLELPWNPAAVLVVTGMNDGRVPEGEVRDLFLPDSLRGLLGLRQDAQRAARDAFLMTGLIESRRGHGRVCFICSRLSARGDPLKPSRLLFRCADGRLPDRVRRLLGGASAAAPHYAPAVSFRLDVRPPPDLRAALDVRILHVTAFREYLACPFRFYLSHILDMAALDDEQGEMNALDFGTLLHAALDRMASEASMRRCNDEQVLAAFLCDAAERLVADRYGSPAPLQIAIQLDGARQRLRAAARIQAEQVRAGWELLGTEKKARLMLGGIEVRGTIDRLDRHRETGELRILDYKTSDKAQEPEKTHLGGITEGTPSYARTAIRGREAAWLDLQLPLYQILLAADAELPPGPFRMGYFHLPKAVSETGIATWDDWTPEWLDSVRTCAGGVVADVQARRFWPPADRVRNEDPYETMFPGPVPEFVDAAAFEAALREGRA